MVCNHVDQSTKGKTVVKEEPKEFVKENDKESKESTPDNVYVCMDFVHVCGVYI